MRRRRMRKKVWNRKTGMMKKRKKKMSKRMILLRYKCDETHSSAMITRQMSLKHVFEISTSIADGRRTTDKRSGWQSTRI